MAANQQFFYLEEEKQIITIISPLILILNLEAQNIHLVIAEKFVGNPNVLTKRRPLGHLIIFRIKNLDKMD